MESWENKILKDKLDSLQQLPAAYSPDLGSKWEIIAAGLPEKKRTVSLLKRWSVAAAIFICIMLVGLKMTEQKAAQTGLGAVTMKPLSTFNSSTEKIQKTSFVVAHLSKKIKPQKEIFTKPASAKELVVKQEILPSASNEIKINVVDEKLDSATITTNELAVTIPQTETPRRAKRRTFQKDFNDGVLVMDTGYSKSANPQFGFKFQLHTSPGDDAQPSRRLQLKQVL